MAANTVPTAILWGGAASRLARVRVQPPASGARRAAAARQLWGTAAWRERPAADQPHRDVEPVIGRSSLVDRDDVRVIDSRLQQRFPVEAVRELRIVAAEQLERDRAVQRELGGLIDHGHPTASEEALDPEARELRAGGEHRSFNPRRS